MARYSTETDCLKDFEDEIVDCLCTSDPSSLAGEFTQCRLLPQGQADFNPYGPHSEAIRYLLNHVYEQLQALGSGSASFERCLDVLHKHGVSDLVLTGVRRKYYSSHDGSLGGDNSIVSGAVECNSDLTAASHTTAMDLVSVKETHGLETSRVVSGAKRVTTRNYFTEKHILYLTEILVKYSSMWYEIGVSLNLPRNMLKNLQQIHLHRPNVCMDELVCEWISGKHKDAKSPTLENLKGTLRSNMVNLGNVANHLEQSLLEQGVHLSEGPLEIPLAKRPCLEVAHITTSSAELPQTGRYVPPAKRLRPESTRQDEWIEICQRNLKDIYLAQPELPEDSWPPVSHETFINLALIKQGDIKDSAHFTIQGDMDDVYRDKDSISYESVFSDLSRGACLLIEGRPGSGKTTLVHKVSQDWAKGELLLDGIKLLFLVHLRHFFSDPNITIRDILKNHFLQETTVDQILKFAEHFSGEGLCFILDGLDEYVPKKTSAAIFKLIRREVLPKALVIVASRPAALASFRKKATMRVETLGFLKGEIKNYVRNYNFFSLDKVDALLSYLDLHPNVMHMCYLPIHTAMVCFLYDKMGNALPRTETEMYEKFTLYTLLRALFREQGSDSVPPYTSIEHLPQSARMLFEEICHLAFQKTISSQQVMKGSEIERLRRSVHNSKDSLGLITVDRVARKEGMETLYTFLHLTFQEYLAAYHVAHLPEEEQTRLISEYGGRQEKNMWKFYCGLMKDDQALKFSQLMKFANDDLFKVQCAFESGNISAICDHVVHSGSSGILSFYKKFFNPTDFAAIGHVLSSTTYPVKEFIFNKCKFGKDEVNTLLQEAGEKVGLISSLSFHGGNCSPMQFTMVSYLLQHISHLEALDISKTTLGLNKLKEFTKELNLPNLQLLTLSDNQCSNSQLKLLSKILPEKYNGKICTSSISANISIQNSIIEVFGAGVLVRSICSYYSHVNLQNRKLDHNVINIISSYSHYTKLIFTNCNMGDEGAERLASGLKTNLRLEILKVNFNLIGDDGGVALADGLVHCSRLRFLDVSCNEIGDRGAIAIAEAVKTAHDLNCAIWNDRLTEKSRRVMQGIKSENGTLCFDCNGIEIGDNEVFALKESSVNFSNLLSLKLSIPARSRAEFIEDCLKQCVHLQALHLDNCHSVCWSLKSLIICKTLLVIEFSNCKLDIEDIKALNECLHACNGLHTLHLDGNGLGANGAEALTEGLKHCSNLHTLHLDGNGLGPIGAKALAEGLKHCSNLHTLHLDGNGLGANGAKALAEGLKHCSNLHTLHLDGNGLGPIGAKALAEGLKHCSNLHTLHLDRNELFPDGAKALAEGLEHCNSLHTLHMNQNRLGTDGALALAEGLKHSSSLHTLHLDQNELGADGAKALTEGLKHCSSLYTLYLDQNRLGAGGAKALAEGLKYYRKIHTLHLYGNGLGTDGTKALAEGLKYCSSLHTLNFGLNDLSADGAKALAEGLKHCSSLHTLHLNQNDLCDGGAVALAEGLKHCSSLHTLDLSLNKIAADGANALAEGLKHCSSLHTLNLSGNGIAADGAKALAEGLKHCSSLHTLDLSLNKIAVDGAKALAEGLKHCSSLHTLDLSLNKIAVDGAKALAEGLKHCSSLHTLDLSRNGIADDGAKALAEGLKHCSSLHTPNLSLNRIVVDGAKALAEGLEHCSSLHTLNLSGNGIAVGGAKALAEGLKHCSSLHTLDLSGNGIAVGGAKALAEGLKHCSSLHTLDLSLNRIAVDGAKALAEGLKHCSSLHTLNLSGNEIADDGAKALAEGLKHCSLHTLNLSRNGIVDGAKALAEGLKHCSSLHTLNLSENGIAADGAKALAEGLKHCSSLHTLKLSGN